MPFEPINKGFEPVKGFEPLPQKEKSLAEKIGLSDIYKGYLTGASGFYKTGANIVDLINAGSDYMQEITGIGPKAEDTALGRFSSYLKDEASRLMPTDKPETVAGYVNRFIGQAPGEIAAYATGAKALGPTGGFAAVDFLRNLDKGPVEAAEEAAKGAVLGKAYEATQGLSMLNRMATMGATGAAVEGATGGDIKDIASAAAIYGGLGAIGQRGGAGFTAKTATRSDEEARRILESGYELPERAANIKLANIETADDVKYVLNNTAQEFSGKIDEARRGVITLEETGKLADDLGMTPDDLLSRRKGQAFNAEEALAARRLLVESAENLTSLAKKAVGGSDDDIVAFQEALTKHAAIQEQISGVTAEAGRALSQFRIKAASDKARVQAVKNIIANQGGRDKSEKMAELLGSLDSPQAINKFAVEAAKAKTSDKLLEAWINSLLSGPQTHAVNVTSNSLVALWQIPENLIAAGIGKLHGGEKIYFRDVMARIYGMAEGGKDGVRLAAKAFKTGEPTDELSKLEMAKYKAIPGVFGEVVRIPGRFLMAEDEFFKSVGYRMELNSLAMRDGISKGLSGQDLAKHIENIKNNPPEDIALKAIQTARYQTFTKELGDFGQSVQRLAASHPAARVLMPFVRTPINIVKFAGERSPLAFFSKAVRDEIAKGGAARDLQLARIGFGTLVGSSVVSYAQEGMITGGGPTDPSEREALYRTGWQPYSIKVGDKYYAYNRLEPLGMLFGISADYAELSKKMDQNELDDLASMIAGSISKNLISKTWLKGLSDTFEMFSDPDRYGEKFVLGYAGTLIPTGVAQVARVDDPVLRQAHTVLDKLRSRIPGLSEDLPPRLNLWGEPIKLEGGVGPDIVSPVYVSSAKNDKVSSEIVRLGLSPDMPKKEIQGVKLSQEQHNEYISLAGATAKQSLNALMSSPGYENLPDAMKRDAIEEIIKKHRKVARGMMLNRHPELITELQNKKISEIMK